MDRPLKLTVLLLIILLIALSVYLLWPTPSPLAPKTPSPTPSQSTLPSPIPSTASNSPYPSEVYEQGELDYQFNQDVLATYDQYPFITKLPIITDHYTILFDFQTNSIRVRLHNTTQPQVEAQVTQQLQSIGVDITKIPIKYVQ